MNDEQMRDLFREMRDEPLPADSLVRVRMGVAERIAQPVRRPWWLRWQVLAAGVVGVALVVVLVSRPAAVVTPVSTPVVAQRETPVVEEKPVVAPRVRPAQARVRPKTEKKDALIRLETEDPNVLIFLVAEGAGE